MSDDRLQIRIAQPGMLEPDGAEPVVLRSSCLTSELTALIAPEPADLDDLLFAADSVNPDWREDLVERLREQAPDGLVTYVVQDVPPAGDITVQHLLSLELSGQVSVTIERSPGTASLETAVAAFPAPQVYVDVLTLLELDLRSPFAGGSMPLSSNQTTVLTNTSVPDRRTLQRVLLRQFGPDAPVYFISGDGSISSDELTLVSLAKVPAAADCILIPAATGDRFYSTSDDLQRLVARLRAPGGCPWDREQTNRSLTRNLIEESYELLEAIESGDVGDMREEMGDFLLQAYLHCQVAEEAEHFTLEDVLDTLITKLVRRHPHVFASATADDSGAVVRNWDEIKRGERSEKPGSENGGPLGNVPISLPALSRAQTLLKRARRSGIASEVVDQRRDEAVGWAVAASADRRVLSDLVLAVERAAEDGIDLEEYLRNWTSEFENSLSSMPGTDATP